MRRIRFALHAALMALALVVVLPGAAFAVQPDEVLDDPALEDRARELSKGLRCLVCRNESIDESNADLARDLRILVRERLVAGDTDDEVIDFVVERYGEYVLLKPRFDGSTWILWAAGPVMLLLAAGIGIGYIRSRETAKPVQEAGLSDEEKARLTKILDE